MSTTLQLRRGTTANHSAFVGAAGEVTVDTTLKNIRIHDGVTPGGTLAGGGAADVAGAIVAAGAKATPVDADSFGIVDSAASNVLKKITWAQIKAALLTAFKDVTGGLVGLTGFSINFKNAAGTFTSLMANANTAARTYTFKDADGTVAFMSDIAGGSADGVGFRNRIINGAMAVDQRNAGVAQTITAAAALGYCVDRFYVFCTGANATGQQIAGAIANTYRYRITGAASNTGVGFGTRLEAVNTAMMASTTVVLSAKLASSSLTSLTWTAYYAATKDTFGTLASPTRTQIATGTFTINNTEATYSASMSVPSGATTGIEVVFTGGALTATQTLTIGDVQFEPGSTATAFEVVPYQTQLYWCYRYCYNLGTARQSALVVGQRVVTNIVDTLVLFPVEMRAAPTFTSSSPAYVAASPSGNQVSFYNNAIGNYEIATGAVTVTTANSGISGTLFRLQAATSFSGSGGNVGNIYIGATAYLRFTSEL